MNINMQLEDEQFRRTTRKKKKNISHKLQSGKLEVNDFFENMDKNIEYQLPDENQSKQDKQKDLLIELECLKSPSSEEQDLEQMKTEKIVFEFDDNSSSDSEKQKSVNIFDNKNTDQDDDFNVVEFVNKQIKPNTQSRLQIRRKEDWLNKFYPVLTVLKSDTKQFVMAAKKISLDTFIISHSEYDFKENGQSYIGKMKQNFAGSLMNVFGQGLNLKNAKQKNIKPRQLLATIQYETGLTEESRPRNFQVYLKNHNINYYQDLIGEKSDDEIPLNQLYKFKQNRNKITVLRTRQAKWSKKIGCFTMDMKGRVKVASIKNFILQCCDTPGVNSLLFGKIGNNKYIFDISAPLTPFIAFCIATTVFTAKIGC